jgi:hypothetical protein
MTKSTKSRSRNRAALQRAAMVAAAGIAAATDMAAADAAGVVAAPPTMAGHPIAPEHIRITAGGVAIHSQALANGLRMNRAGTIRALQARFPGLRSDQVALGPGDTVEFRMGRDAFRNRLEAGDNGSCGNIFCGGSLRLPSGGQMERMR